MDQWNQARPLGYRWDQPGQFGEGGRQIHVQHEMVIASRGGVGVRVVSDDHGDADALFVGDLLVRPPVLSLGDAVIRHEHDEGVGESAGI